MELLETFLAGTGASSALVFVMAYTVVARWWKTPEGRALVGGAGTMFLYALHGLLTASGGAWWLLEVAGHGCAALLMLALTARALRVQFTAHSAGGGRKIG